VNRPLRTLLSTRLNGKAEPIEIAREHVPCALCGKDDTELLFELGGHNWHGVYVNGVFHPVAGRERLVRCRECGLIYVNPRLVEAPGIAAYSAKEELAYYQITEADRRVGNAGLLWQMEGLLPRPGRLLDVGCGDGLLLAQAQLRGWEGWGLEVSEQLVTRLRARHKPSWIFHGVLADATYPAAHFDAVVLCNVIEHLRDPEQVMAEVARITRPGGVVVVHTPNADTLGRLLTKNGFVVVGSFAMYGRSRMKRWLLALMQWSGLKLDNGLGLLARRQA
jgi:SAM-dependent methyltransferase